MNRLIKPLCSFWLLGGALIVLPAFTLTPPAGAMELRSGAGVFVFPPRPAARNAIVLLPDGTELDVSASQTAGLQEAVDYAYDHGWDLFIYGTGPESSGPYRPARGLRIPALQSKTIRIIGATLDFGSLSDQPALTFDSAMAVDFKMTGALLAPMASPAVRFRPVTPLPLDGPLYGAIGVVTSRFSFDRVTGNQSGVEMDTTVAGFIDNIVYFGDIQVSPGGSPITRIGSKFSHNVRDAGPDFDFSSQPAFSNRRGVVVLPPAGPLGEAGIVLLPGGGHLPTPGTQTAGVQEAIHYAVENGLDLSIYGRGLQFRELRFVDGVPTYPTSGFYQMLQTVAFPPLPRMHIHIYGAVFHYAAVLESAMRFDAADQVDFELAGQLVRPGTTIGVQFAPTSGPIRYSRFKIGHVGPGKNVGAWLDTGSNAITGNSFTFHELLQNEFGVRIRASNPVYRFAENKVRSVQLHDFTQVGAQAGIEAPNAGQIQNNDLMFLMDTDGKMADVGVQVWGTGNRIQASLRPNTTSTPATRGISYESSAAGNDARYRSLYAVTPVFQSSPGANSAQPISDADWLAMLYDSAPRLPPAVRNPPAPDLSGVQGRVYAPRDTIAIAYPHSATGFNWELGPAAGSPAGSSAGTRSPGSPSRVTTASPRFNLSALSLTPGPYTVRVQALDGVLQSNWATASITLAGDILEGFRVYPNPARASRGDTRMTFDHLPANSTVKIFAVSGRWVRTLSAPAGAAGWDLTTDGGEKAASGLYLYLITDGQDRKARGRFTLIR